MTIGLFIVGTDTAVGKTYVTAQLARQLRCEGHSVGIYKPACSGAERDAAGRPLWTDAEIHFAALGETFPRDRIAPQCFFAPLAPPVAARQEGRPVDEALLVAGAEWWIGRVDILLIEGAGGLLSPLSDQRLVADLAGELGFPLLIVGRLGLGAINQALLTIAAAEARGLPIAGIVLNQGLDRASGPAEETNPAELAARTTVPILQVLKKDESLALNEPQHPHRISWSTLARKSGRFPAPNSC